MFFVMMNRPEQHAGRSSALEYAGRRGQDEIDQVAERMKRQEQEKQKQMQQVPAQLI